MFYFISKPYLKKVSITKDNKPRKCTQTSFFRIKLMFCDTRWLNNIPENLHNFNKKDPSEAFHLDSEYDIGSVMHYGGYGGKTGEFCQQSSTGGPDKPSEDKFVSFVLFIDGRMVYCYSHVFDFFYGIAWLYSLYLKRFM